MKMARHAGWSSFVAAAFGHGPGRENSPTRATIVLACGLLPPLCSGCLGMRQRGIAVMGLRLSLAALAVSAALVGRARCGNGRPGDRRCRRGQHPERPADPDRRAAGAVRPRHRARPGFASRGARDRLRRPQEHARRPPDQIPAGRRPVQRRGRPDRRHAPRRQQADRRRDRHLLLLRIARRRADPVECRHAASGHRGDRAGADRGGPPAGAAGHRPLRLQRPFRSPGRGDVTPKRRATNRPPPCTTAASTPRNWSAPSQATGRKAAARSSRPRRSRRPTPTCARC